MAWIQNNTIFFRQFSPGARYLAGVSGGRDSVALLHWLNEHGYKKLTVCHLNHCLRGQSSGADARFVEELAAKYGAEFVTRSANVRALATKLKMSIEAAAREARYKFFAQAAKRKRCRTVFLAHHADDLVETFLINLFRGSGTAGLAGMREISARRIEGVELTIGRPFLGVWRSDIDKYVRKYRLKFCEDASNKDLGPLRNRIRRRIIPYLEQTLGRNIRQSIWRAAAITAEEESWIGNQLAESEDLELSVRKLGELPVALQRRQILKWLRAQNIANVGFDVIERVRSLLGHESHIAKINLPQHRHVRRRAGKIFVE
jgi:tRNA(Ile)-lysidine synthase